MNSISVGEYLAPCCSLAEEAGALIMTYFKGRFETSHKPDESPVTEADIAANRLIVNGLRALTPHLPIIAEEDETQPAPANPDGSPFWLVDPLDGTKSFVRGEGEFTVNIALIHHARPVLGVIYVPTLATLYHGSPQGAFRRQPTEAERPIRTRAPAADGLVVVRSRSHPSAQTQAYLHSLPIKQSISGSSSVKFCHIAEGSADLYPRFGRTMEWDTAAGHAILDAAGGRVETTGGQPFLYGKPGFENPAFIAYGRI